MKLGLTRKDGTSLMNPLRLWIVILLVALPLISSAQKSSWSFVLSSGDTLSTCTLRAFDDSLLTIDCNGTGVSLPVDSVETLFRRTESHFWPGAWYGTMAGAVFGVLIGVATYQEPQRKPGDWIILDFGPGAAAAGGFILGAVGGFAIGGIIGASTEGEDKYELSRRNRPTKLRIIRIVMLGDK
jgi:hypothetical protein